VKSSTGYIDSAKYVDEYRDDLYKDIEYD